MVRGRVGKARGKLRENQSVPRSFNSQTIENLTVAKDSTVWNAGCRVSIQGVKAN